MLVIDRLKTEDQMNTKLPFIIFVSTVALIGCAPVKGIDEKGITAVFTNESAKSFVAGFQPAEVSVTRDGSDLMASCELTSSKYAAKFTTPAIVNIPAYSQGAVNAVLTCTDEGETKSATFAPLNLSKKARTDSAVGVALLCPICGIGYAAANAPQSGQKSDDIYGFNKIELEFQKT